MSQTQDIRERRGVARVSDEDVMRPAKRRVGVGRSPLLGELTALLLIALGVVLAQEAVIRSGVGGRSWTSQVLSWLDGLAPEFWMVVAGGVAVLIGLWALSVAVRPRPRTTIELDARTAVGIRATDLARLAAAHIDGLDGVTDTSVTSTRRRVDVRVTTLAAKESNDAIRRDAQSQLEQSLAALDHPPRVRVTIKNEDLS